MQTDLDQVFETIAKYRELLARALLIVSKAPHYCGVEHEENAALYIDDDQATISWVEYESDYYGGGSLNERSGSFPLALLLMEDDAIKEMQRKVAADEQERVDKVARAQEVIRRQREEFHERATLAALKAKYDKPT